MKNNTNKNSRDLHRKIKKRVKGGVEDKVNDCCDDVGKVNG